MKIYNNVLSKNATDIYFKDMKQRLKTQSDWGISDYKWQEEIRVGVSGTQLTTPVSEEFKTEALKTLDQSLPFTNDNRIVMHYCIWLRHSGISWHNDSGYAFTATIYMNKKWGAGYGGLLVWKTESQSDLLTAYSPKFNSMSVNVDQTLHLVTAVSPLASENRFTIQIWGYP